MTARIAKYLLVVPLLMVFSLMGFSQGKKQSLYFWRIDQIGGEVIVDGVYRELRRELPNIADDESSKNLTGGIILRSNSSIIHRNFLILGVDAGYLPESNKEMHLIIPDLNEVRTQKKLDVTASFLREKKVNIDLFGNYDVSLASRENLTNILTTNKHLGGTLCYNNQYFPVILDFHIRKWEEKETETGRHFNLDQKTFGARINKSITSYDKNELRFSREENINVNQNDYTVRNTISNLDFLNSIRLDRKERRTLATSISYFNQSGNIKLKRFQISEVASFQLKHNLSFYTTYGYFNMLQQSNRLQQHFITPSLHHRLFKSLTTKINSNSTFFNSNVYKELQLRNGIEFNYIKRIPGGQLMISYRYDRYQERHTSDPLSIHIFGEQYLLSDGKITLLKQSYINKESVIVRDITGTIIYQADIDYVLVEHNQILEIRRIPGGAILDNGVVLIDYIAVQPGKYKYDANIHFLSTNLSLFKDKLTLYFRFNTQDYLNLDYTDFVVLNYYTQNLTGLRFNLHFLNAGIEYENYRSSILPYFMTRYFLNVQKEIGHKLRIGLNGNYQDYVMLNETEARYQKYLDITGKVNFSIIKQITLNLNLMYRKQTGHTIDLDLFTARSELVSELNKLRIVLGAELYKRNYLGEKLEFKGAYFKIARRF